jgi:hypothetical protein
VHWLPLLWAAVLLLIYVQVWWSMYGLRLHREWTFLAFSIVLAQTATLYVMAAVVLPEQIDDTATDLGVYFDRQHRWFFAFFLATLLVSVIKDVIVNGHLPDRTNLSFHLVLGVDCLAGILLRGRRAQGILALGFAAVMVAYVGLLFARLQ